MGLMTVVRGRSAGICHAKHSTAAQYNSRFILFVYIITGRPGLMSTFSRMAAEWMTPTLITQDGDYTALPTFEGLHAYKIDITQPGRPFEEYLLIENRQATGFEENLWTSGLLIVHVDDFAEGQEFPGWYGQQGWPENGNHYKVAALQKVNISLKLWRNIFCFLFALNNKCNLQRRMVTTTWNKT